MIVPFETGRTDAPPSFCSYFTLCPIHFFIGRTKKSHQRTLERRDSHPLTKTKILGPCMVPANVSLNCSKIAKELLKASGLIEKLLSLSDAFTVFVRNDSPISCCLVLIFSHRPDHSPQPDN